MITIVTADDGKIESYAVLTRKNKQDYAAKHGYPYLNYDLTLGQEYHPHWEQIRALLHALHSLKEGDWLMYSGTDSVIINDAIKLESFIDEKVDLIITHDKCGLNNGVFFLKNSEWGRSFLNKVWEYKGQTVYGWHEQGAFIKVLEEYGAMEHVRFLPQELINAYEPCIYGPDYKEGNFIHHYPGKKTRERVYFIKRALGLVPRVELPEAHWIDEYGVVREPLRPEEE